MLAPWRWILGSVLISLSYKSTLSGGAAAGFLVPMASSFPLLSMQIPGQYNPGMSVLPRSMRCRFRWSLRIAFALAALGSCSLSAQSEQQRYLDDIKALTTPQMEGRGDGTKGLTLAARMIEQRYKALGLAP